MAQQKGKRLLLAVATIAVLIVLTLSFYTILNNNSGIDNNINNNIDGENVDVDNTIENNISQEDNNDIDNQINNDIDVSVDVRVSNDISNSIESELDEENGNGDDEETENGDNGNDNGNGNGNGDNGDENDNGNGDDGNGNGNVNGETPETVWGVDSASITDENMLECVTENYGDPEVWGRYLGDNEGVSYGITDDEIDLLQANDIQTLVIWNHTTDVTGYDHGQNEAEEAIEMARDHDIPEDIALFINVEPIYPVDSAFILGWYDALMDSEYESGIYGVFDPDEEIHTAFEAAAEENNDLLDDMYVWTSSPNIGITTEEEAPAYDPDYPDGALLAGWQYGLDDEICNIDTNHFDGNVLDALW